MAARRAGGERRVVESAALSSGDEEVGDAGLQTQMQIRQRRRTGLGAREQRGAGGVTRDGHDSDDGALHTHARSRSRSRSRSPQEEEEEEHDVAATAQLPDLVEMLLVSKRSLATTQLVWRARELVDGARGAVEENAVLAARNAFVGGVLGAQLEALWALRAGVAVVEREGTEELKVITEALDKASGMLDATLGSLREITVDAGFRPDGEQKKVLFDFVDESGVEDLYESIRKSIDRCDAARQSLVATYTAFDQDLALVKQSMEHRPQLQDAAGDDMQVDEETSPVPEFFLSLEQDATTCAEHLQGLVKHYDLCVTALKHTEGGGAIISKYSADDEQSKLAGFELGMAGPTDVEDETLKPLSPAEQAEMLQILMRDAAEVDEVVTEIQDRLLEMEDSFAAVQRYVELLRATTRQHARALSTVRRVVARSVPGYIGACAEFQAQWAEEQEALVEKIEEIEQLREFYHGFAAGYDNLIVEVQRRKEAMREMAKVARHAMSQIEKMHRIEVATRDEFRTELGEYLPNDIWPGLVDAPPRFEISTVGDDAALPDLSREVVHKAMQRLKARLET